MNNCLTCGAPFDDGLHRNCGGDCLLCMAEAGDPDCARPALRLLRDRVIKLEDFKAYVHQRLDKMGVPNSVPESEHDKAGCRIGGRLDWVEAAEDRATKLRRGNTILLEALMDMVNQFFYEKDLGDWGGTVLTHTFMSAEEHAIAALVEAGMASEVSSGYVLLWDKLAARKRDDAGWPRVKNC